MTADVRSELRKQGFEEHRIHVERMLNMRFEGTDTALMVLPHAEDGDGNEDFESAFKRVYKAEFGFLLEKSVIVDDIKVNPLFFSCFQPTKLMMHGSRCGVSAKHSTHSVNPSMLKYLPSPRAASSQRKRQTLGTACTLIVLDVWTRHLCTCLITWVWGMWLRALR